MTGNGNETRISNMIFLFFTNVYKKHLQTTEIKDTFQLSFTYVRASPCGNGKKSKLKVQEQKGLG